MHLLRRDLLREQRLNSGALKQILELKKRGKRFSENHALIELLCLLTTGKILRNGLC